MRLFSRGEQRATQPEPTSAQPVDDASPQAGTAPARRTAAGAPSEAAVDRPTSRRARRREGLGRRERVGRRTRDAGAATVGTLGSGAMLLARLVMTAATLIAVLIALAIVLRDVDANQSNTIVKGIHEGANFFAGAFTGLITFSGHPKRAITVDWGIALLAYLLVGSLIASMIARIGRGGLRYERVHRVAPMP
jgi:hypothetical protein